MSKRLKKTAAPQEQVAAGPWWATPRTWAVVLAGLAFLIYANSIPNGFVLDDSMIILKNNFTNKGLAGIGKIFTTNAFEGFYGDDVYWIKVYGARYRPLSMAVFAVIYQFFGASPTAFHGWNVLTYALCCVALFWVLHEILRQKLQGAAPVLLAGLATLLFTVHPVHTEVVDNIKSNDEILSLLLSLASLHQAIQYYKHGRTAQVVASGALLFLGCLAKENAITFLAIIPLAYLFVQKEKRSVWPLIASLGGAVAAYFIIRWAVIGLSLDPTMELINNPFVKVENGQWVSVSTQERLAMTFYSLGKYLQLLVFPHPLTTDYYPRYVEVMKFSNPVAIASLLAYLALGGFLAVRILKGRVTPVVFGLFFFLASLSIVSNLVFPIGTNLAERFLFAPSAGFCLAVAGLLYPVFAKKEGGTNKAAWAVLGLVVLLFSAKVFTRNFDFESNKTLFYKDLEVSANSAKMQNAVGALIAEEALTSTDPAAKIALAQKAMTHLNKAIEIHPSYLEAFYMRANTDYLLGDFEAAVLDYRQCLTLNPNYSKALGNYALALREAGRRQMQPGGNLQQAVLYLEESSKLFPQEQETLQLLQMAKGTAPNPAGQ